jgi:hypothetical protein
MSNLIKNKKAISEIITTVLIILGAILAMGLISVAITKLVKIPSLSPESSCLQLQIEKPIQINKACFNKEENKTQITLTRTVKESKINNLEFLLNYQTNANSWTCGNQCGNCIEPNIGQTKTYYFNTNEKAEQVSIKINNCVIESKELANC